MPGDLEHPVLLVVLRTAEDVALAERQLQAERIPHRLQEVAGGRALRVEAQDVEDARRALGAYGLLGSFVAPAAPIRPGWRILLAAGGLGVTWLTAPTAFTAFAAGRPAFYHPTKWSPVAGWFLTFSLAVLALAGVAVAAYELRQVIIERRQARNRERRIGSG